MMQLPLVAFFRSILARPDGRALEHGGGRTTQAGNRITLSGLGGLRKDFLATESRRPPDEADGSILVLREWLLKADHDEDLQGVLTDYATIIRYPGAGLEIPLSEARQAVAVVRRIRREVRRLLPRAALRRK
jgi:hypothetical protein